MLLQMNKKYKFLKTDAQSTVEYAVLVACVVAALLGMQIYMKRGIQGKLRQGSDEIGEQYAPLSTDSSITTNLTSNITITQAQVPLTNETGVIERDANNLIIYGLNTTTNFNETTRRTGNENLGQFEDKLF